MRAVVLMMLALTAGPACAAAPADPGKPPDLAVGGCEQTTVTRVEPRVQGQPDSGVFIAYADGVTQSTYQMLPGAAHSRPGDPVKLCLERRPKGCPKGDARGAVYVATNGRTGETWSAADSSHVCGGA